MSEGTPIDSLPEWPADQPLPEDAVTVYGVTTVEEAHEYLEQQREAEVRRQSALESDQRRRRERHAADAQQRAAVFEGLARLGRGETDISGKQRRNRSPAQATLMALGFAMARHADGHSQEKAAELATDAIPGVSTRRVYDLLKEVAAGKR